MGMHSTFELSELSFCVCVCFAIAFPRPRCTRNSRFYGSLVNRSQPTLKLSAIYTAWFCSQKLQQYHVLVMPYSVLSNALACSSILHPLYNCETAYFIFA